MSHLRTLDREVRDPNHHIIGRGEGHKGGLNSVHYCSISRLLSTTSKDGTARIWRAPWHEPPDDPKDVTSSLISSKAPSDKEPPTRDANAHSMVGAAWAPRPVDDGVSQVAIWSEDGRASVWTVSPTEPLRLRKVLEETGTGSEQKKPISDASWSSMSCDKLVTACEDNSCVLWAVDSGLVLRHFKYDAQKKEGHTDAVWSVRFAPTEDNRFLTASRDGTALIYDVKEDGKVHRTFNHCPKDTPQEKKAAYGVTTAEWADLPEGPKDAPNGPYVPYEPYQVPTGSSQREAREGANLIVTGSMDHAVRLWDIRSPPAVKTFEEHSGPVTSAVFGRWPLLLSASLDMTAVVRDLRSERVKFTLAGHHGVLWHASFSPDYEWVVTCSEDGAARVWSLKHSSSSQTVSKVLREEEPALRNRNHQGVVTCACWINNK